MPTCTDGIDIRDAFFDTVYDLAAHDTDVVFMTADADAFSLRRYRKDFPARFVNVGVAEQNMVCVAAGLALSGKKVFVYSIIPFLTMRCYEQIKVNVCSMNLPVTIVGAGAGLSFAHDGPTHHAVSDIAIMRKLPELSIFNPSEVNVAAGAARAAYAAEIPAYVRLDKGVMPQLHTGIRFDEGMAIVREGADLCIVATGLMVHTALEVAAELSLTGIESTVVDLYRVKPLNEEFMLSLLDRFENVVTLEENTVVGGIGSMVGEVVVDHHKPTRLKRIGLREEQCFQYGSREWLHHVYAIDKEGIITAVRSWLRC